MSSDPAEISSSDIALKFRAPSCVANRWRLTTTWEEETHIRVKRRFAFLETALRYLVGTLAVEHAALGLAAVPSWHTLKHALGRPATLGLWRDAARDLSVAVLGADRPVLEPIARVLAERDGTGARQAEVIKDLDHLVTLRNEEAHPELVGLELGPMVLEDSEAPFRRLLSCLRRIGKLPVWVVTKLDFRDGTSFADVRCLRGLDPGPPREIALARPIETGRPFVVSADGRLLYLSPMVAWGKFGPRGFELRLFQGWKKGALFADPMGLSEAPAGKSTGQFGSWFEAACRGALVEGTFLPDTQDLDVLLDPDRAEAKSEVPGYRLGASLGYGGNGRVYLARDMTNGAQVALKLLSSALVADPAARERLRRECEMMQAIEHPNVARVYAFLPDTPSGPVLVMEYVMGENLRRCEGSPLSIRAAEEVMRQVLAGLASAHGRGIVHRDVTPENVVCGPLGGVKLLDFGIALAADNERLTRTLDGLGKLHFAAPEQVGGDRAIGPSADVYAAGRLLGYLVSGSADPGEHLSRLPGGLQAFYRQATDREPSRRFADASEMAKALEAASARGWEGAPVAPGERLSPDFEVVAIERSLGSGIWLLRIRGVQHGERVMAVVAERRPEAEQALQRAMAELSEAGRRHLGHPDRRTTRDEVEWYLLRVGSVEEMGGAFGTPHRAPAEPAKNLAVKNLAETPTGGHSLRDAARHVAARAAAERATGDWTRAEAARVAAPPTASAEAARASGDWARADAARVPAEATPVPRASAAASEEAAPTSAPAAGAEAARVRPTAARAGAGAEAARVQPKASTAAAAEAAPRAPPTKVLVEHVAPPTKVQVELVALPPAERRSVPSWSLPSRRESGEETLATSAFPGGSLLGPLLMIIPFYWPVLIVSLLRRSVVTRIPPRPILPVPAYIARVPRFDPTTPPSIVARELDRLALAVLAQRHLAGVESEPLATVASQPLLATWRVLTLPPDAHLMDHRAYLVGARGRLLAQSAVRLVYDALAGRAPRVSVRGVWRVNNAALALHRLAHGGCRRAPGKEVTRMLAEWGFGGPS